MPVIHYENAINKIYQAHDYAVSGSQNAGEFNLNKTYSPFFYIVGSGISTPVIPTASEMIKSFQDKIGDSRPLDNIKRQKSYSELFMQAYPNPVERRDYLYKLIKGKPITQANFLLARLLTKSPQFSKLVVTTNFDDQLARALTLFGVEPILFDHPASMQRTGKVIENEVQIVHAHGTYIFYDCCNLTEEIKDRANDDQQGYYNSIKNYMLSLLKDFSPIIIGYSGWEDVIVEAIRERLKSSVAYNYYWFCYSAESYKNLHDDLKKSPNIFFVVNDSRIGTKILNNKDYLDHISSTTEIDTSNFKLNSALVFEELIRRLNTADIELFANPLKFFNERLTSVFTNSQSTSLVSETGYYDFQSTIDVLKKAKQLYDKDSNEDIHYRNNINELIKYGQNGNHTESIMRLKSLFFDNNNFSLLTIEQRSEVVKVFFWGLKGIFRSPTPRNITNENILLLKEFNHLLDDANWDEYFKDVSKSEMLAISKNIGMSVTLRNKTLRRVGSYAAQSELKGNSEVTLYLLETIIKKCQISPITELLDIDKASFSSALHSVAVLKYDAELGLEVSIKKHQEVIDEFKNIKLKECQENVLRSLVAQGWLYDTYEKYEKAITPYNEIIASFSDSSEDSYEIHVANAKFYLAKDYLEIAKRSTDGQFKKGYFDEGSRRVLEFRDEYADSENQFIRDLVEKRLPYLENMVKRMERNFEKN